MRTLLQELLTSCDECRRVYESNVSLLVADDDGVLTDEQVQAVLAHLVTEHENVH